MLTRRPQTNVNIQNSQTTKSMEIKLSVPTLQCSTEKPVSSTCVTFCANFQKEKKKKFAIYHYHSYIQPKRFLSTSDRMKCHSSDSNPFCRCESITLICKRIDSNFYAMVSILTFIT